MLSGVKLYVALGIGAFILLLMGSVAFLWQVHKTDIADLGLAKQAYKQISNALAESEADKADLARKAQALDEFLVAQRKRADALQLSNSKLADQLHALESTLPKADQDCATRPLPDSVLEWLRDGSGSDEVRHEPAA